MAYIGKTPTVGNFQVCDAISVVNGQAAYTLQVGGVNVTPESANHMLVSLNGILQKPGSSFTVSGSTMTFASNLATGDSIDFVQILGNVLDIGQPSDDTVTAAKLNNDIISGQTALSSEPADTDEFLVSDAGTLKRLDYSLIKASPAIELVTTTTVSSAVAQVDFTSLDTSTYKHFKFVISHLETVTDDVRLYMRMITSTDTVETGSSAYTYATSGHREDNSALDGNGTGNAYIDLSPATIGSTGTGEVAHAVVYLFDPANTSFQKFINAFTTITDTGNRVCHGNTAGRWSSTTAVTGVRFYLSSGNINTGLFKAYGIK